MKIIPLAIALIFLAFVLPIASASAGHGEKDVHVKDSKGNDISKDNIDNSDDDKPHASDDDSQENESNTGFESINESDYVRNEISAGNKLFVESLITGLYEDLKGNSTDDGVKGGIVYSAITFVPNPYEDSDIVELYGGYQALTIYAVVLFVLGELISRSIARTKLAAGTLKHKDLSGYHFIGGVAMCGLALIANIFYMFALEILEALNEFITVPAIPDLAIDPSSLWLLGLKGLCDLVVVGFFIVRFFLIYVIAVVCGIIAFLLVPEFSREFATDCIEKIIRLLLLQPAALFVMVIGFVAIDNSPVFFQGIWYIGLTALIFLTCWYFMFGKFTLLKTAVVFAIRKGVTKI